ncbi:hypothetical protein SSX86_023812 [Deinandra increscens subsp. villosa]|uniref:C2 NT-type domain-containing protein n=1 Tax=Deinandra increscens subsp. villosa TaxID=3103831 RepID=A0AAP0CI58_9ASTR
MSRVTKWKIEKAKVKVVFRLQFHATNIPQNGWEKLFISFIPNETGKATAKTSKANVRGGSCKWADPIYETTRLLLDSKTKQYDDKLYKVVVGMGTSRSSILGEATINLADYADASQPSVIALPLHGSDHGTILHVTVQLLTAKTGFREFEQQRDKGLQSGNNVTKESEHSTAMLSSSELQIPDDLVNKAKTRIQLREETSIHGEYSDSQVTCDESSNASDTYYADKHESPAEKMVGSDQAKSDNDVAVIYEENHKLRASLAVAESSISKLKQELTALESHANEMGTETEKFAQELTTEIALGQDLVKEVNVLKSECLKLKSDLQNLQETKSSSMGMESKLKKTEHDKEVDGVLLVESQIREIQEKIFIGFHESDLSLLQSDFEVLLGTVQELKIGTIGEIPTLPLQELDIARTEKEDLVKKMDEMECYYESLVQELEENQKRILGDLQNLKHEMNDLSSVNNELQKRVTVSESALKRARLNYSIAVSQLQKDLDMLSFQVLSMFETNQTVIKEAFSDTSQPSSTHLSDDLKKSLSLQENIYKKVEEELGEMCCANLQLNVYSEALVETLFDASDYIRKMNEKLQELGKKLQFSNQSRDVLFHENGYYLAKCNDLQLQNQMLESDLGNLSNENFLLMEKITECEALLMDYRVYKGKYEVVSAEKLELEKLLEVEVYDKHNFQKEIKTLRSEINDVKMKFKNDSYETMSEFEIPNSSIEKLRLQIDSVAKMFKSSLESGEKHVENSEVMLKYLCSLELELQKILSEDKGFHEQVMGLDVMAEEFEKSKLTISELQKENQDLMICIENKREELDRLKECSDVERCMKIKLEDTVACLTSQLESQRLELCHVRKLASDQESEIMIFEDLKFLFLKSQCETWIAELVKEITHLSEKCGEIENKHLDDKARLESYMKENENLMTTLDSIQIKFYDTEAQLNKCLENEARYAEENIKLTTELESCKLRLEDSIAHIVEISNSNDVLKTTLTNVNNTHALVVGQLKDMLTKSKAEVEQFNELQMKFDDTELRLNGCLESEALYIEENRNLATELEALRLELVVSVAKIAEISESRTENALEVSQLKEMLTKSKEEVDRYIEENQNLEMGIEALKLELQASVAKSVEIAESENELTLKAGQLKEMLTESKEEASIAKDAEIAESKNEHALEASQLKEKLTKSKEEAARHIEENRNLGMETESLRSELEASVVKNAECQNEHVVKVGQLKEMLTESKADVARYMEEKRNLVMEIESLRSELQTYVAKRAEIAECKNEHALNVGQLNEMLTKSKDEVIYYVEENKNLAMELESLRLDLQAAVAKNAVIAESENEHALKVGQLKEMLTESKEEVARFIEEHRNLETEIESLRLELQASVAEIAECKNEHAIKVEEMLTQSKDEVTRYVEENRDLATELESLRLDLQASVAKNAEISESETMCALEASQLKEMLSKSKEEVTCYIEESRDLAMEIECCRSELQASVSKIAEISESNIEHALEVSQLKEMLTKSKAEAAGYIEVNKNLATEVESLKLRLDNYTDHTAETTLTEVNYKNALMADDMLISEEESKILLLVLKAKLEEQNDELIVLHNKCNQLTNKLSEQKLKTEEFKNLSIYLKELKDSADVAHGKKEKDLEGPTESLRLAFIKEQYQTKIQELKQQLSVSKRHNEEMLFKLQDALDEIESRKKSEASQLMRIQELEAEGESVISDKPDYDRLQAELECAVLSLECCKEEKEKLFSLLQECENEKSRIADELSLIRETLARKKENGSVNVQEIQRAYEDEENPSTNDSKQLTVVNDQFRTQHLISCMEQLDEELEKMKNDNSLLPLANYDPSFQDLQSELAQLHQVYAFYSKNVQFICLLLHFYFSDIFFQFKANEELGNIYPNFFDFPGDGNALGRVLALEIELAEALRTKKKTSIQFQSSFLKQHSDEEAVFKSFRDINQLIKDMLEIKGKYVNVENELKEMHDRYSQLSLQFAEVEGERQKLMMTLKNVRSSRNLLRLNRSSMAAALGDQTL